MGCEGVAVAGSHSRSVRAGCSDDEDASAATVENVICGYIREEGDDLSIRQIGILILVSQAPIGIGDIGRRLKLSASIVSRSIDALSRLALARRERRGKFVVVSATPLGDAKVGRIVSKAMPLPARSGTALS